MHIRVRNGLYRFVVIYSPEMPTGSFLIVLHISFVLYLSFISLRYIYFSGDHRHLSMKKGSQDNCEPFLVEMGGLEPPSKHRTRELSTRLV